MDAASEWSVRIPGKHWSFRGRGLLGGIGLVVALAGIPVSVPMVAEGTWQDQVLDILGWVSFMAGAALRMWATLYIGARKEWTLVGDGPYSVCRNPLYLGSFLMLTSFAFFVDSVMFIAIMSAVIFAYTVGTVRAEEERLRKTLAQEYVGYCQRVPRFWPRPSLFRTPETIEVRVKGLRLECMRMMRWLLIPLRMEIVSHLRECPWWPHLLRLP